MIDSSSWVLLIVVYLSVCMFTYAFVGACVHVSVCFHVCVCMPMCACVFVCASGYVCPCKTMFMCVFFWGSYSYTFLPESWAFHFLFSNCENFWLRIHVLQFPWISQFSLHKSLDFAHSHHFWLNGHHRRISFPFNYGLLDGPLSTYSILKASFYASALLLYFHTMQPWIWHFSVLREKKNIVAF